MSEGATAVLEKEEGLAVYDEQIMAKWKPHLEKADATLRNAIFKKIEKKEGPDDNLDVNKLVQEEIEESYKRTASLEIKRPGDLYKADAIIQRYTKETKRAAEELGDDSVAKGEVLRKQESWKEYGWNDGDKETVINNLQTVLPRLNLDDKHAEIIVEILLAKGLRPDNLTVPVLKEKLHKAHAPEALAGLDPTDKEYLTPEDLREAKQDPEIIALRLLGIDQKLIKHHILTKEYENDNDHELYFSPGPANIEDLAWNIMHTPGKRYAGWGVKGDFPVLEMRIEPKRKANGEPERDANGHIVIDQKVSGYRVNTSNMVRWARYGMFTEYDRDREDPKDFFQSIALQGRSPLSFNQMLLNPTQYFRSEDGETDYKLLMLEWYKEAAVFSTIRSWDVAYKLAEEDPDELKKVFKEMYNNKNLLTRNALGSSLLNLMTTMPLDFQGRKEGHWESDSTMGIAWIEMFRVYDSMSDYENLRKILGSGSQFFTIKGWEQAIYENAKDNIGVTGVSEMKVFMKKSGYEYFDKAFDANGEITTPEQRKNFIKFINIFGDRLIGGKHEWSIRSAVRNAIAEKYGKEVYAKTPKGVVIESTVDKIKDGKSIYERFPNAEVMEYDPNDPVPEGKAKIRFKKFAFVTDQAGKKGDKTEDRVEDSDSLNLAEAMAWSLVKPFGLAAKNDPDAIGYDWQGRPQHALLFRAGYAHKGDKQGNNLTVPLIKSTVIPIMEAIVTEYDTDVLDEYGNKTYKTEEDRKEGKQITRAMTPMEIFTQLSEFKAATAQKTREIERQIVLNPARAAELRRELADHNKESNQRYQNLAQKASFTQRTLDHYKRDHLEYGMDMYRYLVDAKEIEWEKFTSYDVIGGVRFKQEEFQKEIQTELIHKTRYMLKNFGSLNYNMTVRVMDQAETHRRNHQLGRSMEPAFHEVKLGEAMFGHELLNRAEFWKRDKRGKPINLRDKKGRKMKGLYQIDYQKVQDNKQLVWKQWIMTKIAADFYSHRAIHENDVRFNFTYYQNAIDALGRIPGNVDQDEYNFRDTHVKEYFFNKADLAWLRRHGNVTAYDLYWRAVLKDLFLDDKPEEGIGIFTALSLAMKAIIDQKV